MKEEFKEYIEAVVRAERLRTEKGIDLEVAPVFRDLSVPGFEVECIMCGAKGKLPFDPGGRVGVCPPCQRETLL